MFGVRRRQYKYGYVIILAITISYNQPLVLTVCATLEQMTMKCLIVLCCAAIAVMADEKYTDKYDNVNVDEILENDRLRHAYSECLLDKGKCTAEGNELKSHMQEALETGCKKCSEKQENTAYKVIEFLIKNDLEIWRELAKKFDPEGKWRKHYEERAKARGIVIPE